MRRRFRRQALERRHHDRKRKRIDRNGRRLGRSDFRSRDTELDEHPKQIIAARGLRDRIPDQMPYVILHDKSFGGPELPNPEL